MNTLKITIGDALELALERFVTTFDAALKGDDVEPFFSIGFENMSQFGTVFTPKRWELVEALKTFGPVTIYALAKQLGRHYANVHKDVTTLCEWLVIEKDEDNKVFVPWDEIDVRWPLLRQVA